jgi:hypothetical protein
MRDIPAELTDRKEFAGTTARHATVGSPAYEYSAFMLKLGLIVILLSTDWSFRAFGAGIQHNQSFRGFDS